MIDSGEKKRGKDLENGDSCATMSLKLIIDSLTGDYN